MSLLRPRVASPPPNLPTEDATSWHARTVADALAANAVDEGGLSGEEAAERLERFGPNRVRPAARRGPVARFLLQFHNVLLYVLIVAGLITGAMGHWVDASVILGVVVINALIGFVQEGKAEAALDAIRKMLSLKAIVVRDQRRLSVPAEDLVPGDIVFLQSGDKVPADLRLIRVKSLQTQEAALTGESLPVEKAADPVPPDAPLAERASMAFAGTLVTYGQATGLVVATGEATEVGRISRLLDEVGDLTTPLTEQLIGFSRMLTVIILTLSVAVFAVGVFVYAFHWEEMFLAVVGLAVAAIPEGLPAIVTITLAIGVRRMARRNAIIRRLPAVETLGAVSVICSDKTGTLTRNEMMVATVVTGDGAVTVTGEGYRPVGTLSREGRPVAAEEDPPLLEIARAALLCCDSTLRQVDGVWLVDGDPTEGALIALAMKVGLDPALVERQTPRSDVIPFESEHRFMAALHHDHEGHGLIVVKGAPERLFAMCATERTRDGARPFDADAWQARMTAIAQRGQRVLALAVRAVDPGHRELRFADVEEGLMLLALIGLADPPRAEALAAVARCQSSGVRVKMITGDHALTARAIAEELGLANHERVLTGGELDHLEGGELVAAARDVDVFARTAPEHKLRLVEALQRERMIVAMTGDGVNDAPALKRADIGIAMGERGTEAAKEAAQMVLADDNFASIVDAVEEGRIVYDNLVKAIQFILATNSAQALVIMIAVLLGRDLPITAVQVLWINMVTAVTLSMALAFERAEQDVMQRPPRLRDAPLLSGPLLWRIGFVGGLIVAATFALFLWQVRRTPDDLALARTVAVNALVACETLYLFSARHRRTPALAPSAWRGIGPTLIVVGLIILLQLLFTYWPPMQALFHTKAVPLAAWGPIALAAVLVFVLAELEKAASRRWR